MEQDETKYPRATSKVWTGLFLIVVGILLLANKMNAGIPDWVFTWPTLVMGIGLLIGVQHRFRNFIWFIPFAVGAFGLVSELKPELHLRDYTAPFVFIMLGVFFIARRNKIHQFGRRREEQWRRVRQQREMQFDYDRVETTDGEWIDTTAVFGSTKKVVLSKNFRGGDITCFMGGAEIDLTKADIQGKVMLDTTAVFGGIKLLVPPNWDVKVQTTAVFGGVEDKRPVVETKVDTNKLLILDGAAVFGGIEIKSY
jgi:predicted membrane protein